MKLGSIEKRDADTWIKKPRVLLVDDEPLVRWSLSTALKNIGMEVASVSSAEQAIAKLYSQSYDVVITDLRLPNGNGFDVASTARWFQPGVPVVMISAFKDQVKQDATGLETIDAFVEKPFALHEITELVKQLVT